MTILSILLSGMFLILSLIHFNWVFGGKWGFEHSMPTKENGEKALNPKTFDSAIVGFGLLLFAIYYLFFSKIIINQLPNWIENYAGWIIPTIFLLRAIGDFKYVGFFKKIKNTKFGKTDSKFFSPLCLIIASIGFIILLLNK